MVRGADTNPGSTRIFSPLGMSIMSGLLVVLSVLVGVLWNDLKSDLKVLADNGKKDRLTMIDLNLKIERGLIIDSLVIDQMKKLESSIDDLEDRIP